MVNKINAPMTSTSLVAALSSDLRFTHKVSMYAERKFGKTLCLSGLRDVAREHLIKNLQSNCVIPQANSRVYFGMSLHPTPREQKLNNFAINSGFTLQVNALLPNGKEKAVDTKLVDDAYEYKAQGISGLAVITGDKDFLNLCRNFTTNGIPFILLTARFEKTGYSRLLAESATEVIDILSLLNDPRVFKPVSSNTYQPNRNPYGSFQGNRKFSPRKTVFNNSCPQNNTHYNHMASRPANENLTNTVARAIRTVMRRKSGLNKTAVFSYQNDVSKELQRMGVKLNIPLGQFLKSKSWKFCTGFYNQRATVSVKN